MTTCLLCLHLTASFDALPLNPSSSPSKSIQTLIPSTVASRPAFALFFPATSLSLRPTLHHPLAQLPFSCALARRQGTNQSHWPANCSLPPATREGLRPVCECVVRARLLLSLPCSIQDISWMLKREVHAAMHKRNMQQPHHTESTHTCL